MRLFTKIRMKQIAVNNIDTASGIFVGTNIANNWSSHRKNNYGFGSVSNSAVWQNYSNVQDNDILDTPIQNQSVSRMDRADGSLGTQVDVKEININVIDTASAVSIGDNLLTDWSSHRKANSGLGKTVGTSILSQNAALVSDQDVMDAPIEDVHGGKEA
ncbi:hypothetical protein [Peribacillus kribbensis]|uniref:hypothetical protein n=1 Tax=Peribacillus kribbensis TaxID=356658 RepID=UPI0004014863|nr:hypothetical protein [Peribacillus kribbensis]